MASANSQYQEAWCTNQLRRQQNINEKMSKLNIEQQKAIDRLYQQIADLQGNFGGNDDGQQPDGFHNGHWIGPNSSPLPWNGNVKDFIPVLVKDKVYNAMILTDDVMEQVNTAIQSQLLLLVAGSEQKAMEGVLLDFDERGQEEPVVTPDGTFFGGLDERYIEHVYNQSSARGGTLAGLSRTYVDALDKANEKLNSLLRKRLSRNELFSMDAIRNLEGNLLASKRAIYDGVTEEERDSIIDSIHIVSLQLSDDENDE